MTARISPPVVPRASDTAKSGAAHSNATLVVWWASALTVGALTLLGTWRLTAPSEPAKPPDLRSDSPLLELFGGPPVCRAHSAAAGLHLAELLARRGEAHAESARARATDGPRAVRELGEAAACFELAGRSELAAPARASARRLRDEIEGAVQTHRLRLDRAKESAQPEAALAEVRVLRALFQENRGEYAKWLTHEELLLQEMRKP